MNTTLPLRFWEKVDREAVGGCWQWLAGTNRSGYGRFFLNGGQMAHRLAYIDQVGTIPEGMVIDHLCRNRLCVNPEHMEPVDIRTNVMRGEGAGARHSRKTRCGQGHEFTDANTRVNNLGHRICKICERDWQRAYLSRKADASR